MSDSLASRAEALFLGQRAEAARQTDRLFVRLLSLQWVAAVAVAFWLSPRVWRGMESSTHIHVYASVLLGGLITLVPVLLAFKRPGRLETRLAVAAGQAAMSALLIHLTGGRIETHFHVFGSLAILAFYQDARVLVAYSVLVVGDHVLRGLYWPLSVYGTSNPGAWRWLEHAGWVVFEDVFLMLGIEQRLTDQRQVAMSLAESQERLCQSRKMKAVGQLAAGVAHELNNPLSVILGFAQCAAKDAAAAGSLALPLRSIEREALRCRGLVQDLLTFSRASKHDRAPLDFNLVIKGALSLVDAQARVSGVTVRLELCGELPPVSANANQLQQIVVNLASNAFDAMPAGGTLTVRTQLRGDGGARRAALSVVDTGHGMPPEVAGRVFEPFFTTKEPGKGTGLGLSLVYEIVHKHGGAVSVDSRPGRTEFLIELPIEAAEAAA